MNRQQKTAAQKRFSRNYARVIFPLQSHLNAVRVGSSLVVGVACIAGVAEEALAAHAAATSLHDADDPVRVVVTVRSNGARGLVAIWVRSAPGCSAFIARAPTVKVPALAEAPSEDSARDGVGAVVTVRSNGARCLAAIWVVSTGMSICAYIAGAAIVGSVAGAVAPRDRVTRHNRGVRIAVGNFRTGNGCTCWVALVGLRALSAVAAGVASAAGAVATRDQVTGDAGGVAVTVSSTRTGYGCTFRVVLIVQVALSAVVTGVGSAAGALATRDQGAGGSAVVVTVGNIGARDRLAIWVSLEVGGA
jgi:hypothetical protein